MVQCFSGYVGVEGQAQIIPVKMGVQQMGENFVQYASIGIGRITTR